MGMCTVCTVPTVCAMCDVQSRSWLRDGMRVCLLADQHATCNTTSGGKHTHNIERDIIIVFVFLFVQPGGNSLYELL